MPAPSSKKKTSQQQRNPHRVKPESLANLKRFAPGQSGNPGGNYKRSPKLSNAYARLLALSPAQRKKFKPANIAEELALDMLEIARSGTDQNKLAVVREITDRTEGRAPQRVVVDNTTELERLIIRVQERVFAQTGVEITRSEAIGLITTYRPELGEAIE